MKKSWNIILKNLKVNDLINDIYNQNKTIYPEKKDVLNCFKDFDIKQTKVVFLGQDPYIRKNQATGYAFSVPKYEKIPPSLKNIFREMEESIDGFNIPTHGDVSRWNKEEKVLLLNTALTVEEGKSNSHKKLWTKIIDEIIKEISKKCDFVIFILLGNNAKSKIKFIDCDKHKIIPGIHPSPLSANYNKKGTDKSFFGHNIFNKVNEYLIEKKLDTVDWKLKN